jgi:putative oxidoreductase
MTFLSKYSDLAYLLLRIVFAFLFMSHGYQRVFTGPVLGPPDFPPLGVANVIEVIAGPLLLLGLFTRVFAFIASGEMAVAYFLAHVPRGGMIPLFNMGEITVALCFGFLYIATRGGGRYSLDAMMGRT